MTHHVENHRQPHAEAVARAISPHPDPWPRPCCAHGSLDPAQIAALSRARAYSTETGCAVERLVRAA